MWNGLKKMGNVPHRIHSSMDLILSFHYDGESLNGRELIFTIAQGCGKNKRDHGHQYQQHFVLSLTKFGVVFMYLLVTTSSLPRDSLLWLFIGFCGCSFVLVVFGVGQ